MITEVKERQVKVKDEKNWSFEAIIEMERFYAWAIDSQSAEGHGLLGRYFFARAIPPSAEGCMIALFKTRKVAREYLRTLKSGWVSVYWNPKVVKVKVNVEIIPPIKEKTDGNTNH